MRCGRRRRRRQQQRVVIKGHVSSAASYGMLAQCLQLTLRAPTRGPHIAWTLGRSGGVSGGGGPTPSCLLVTGVITCSYRSRAAVVACRALRATSPTFDANSPTCNSWQHSHNVTLDLLDIHRCFTCITLGRTVQPAVLLHATKQIGHTNVHNMENIFRGRKI